LPSESCYKHWNRPPPVRAVVSIVHIKGARLAKNHYSHGKHMRELAKKQKQEEKKERRLARQNPQPNESADAPAAREES
jgi:hypothetical protein